MMNKGSGPLLASLRLTLPFYLISSIMYGPPPAFFHALNHDAYCGEFKLNVHRALSSATYSEKVMPVPNNGALQRIVLGGAFAPFSLNLAKTIN